MTDVVAEIIWSGMAAHFYGRFDVRDRYVTYMYVYIAFVSKSRQKYDT